jgi:hypothetical protein
MPEPEITARKFTVIKQLSRWPCPSCERPAWTDHHGDVASHIDPADDKLCPELAERDREKARLMVHLEELREAFQAATPERELLPVDARTLAEKAKSIFDAMGAVAYQPNPPPVFATRAQAYAYVKMMRDANTTGWSDLIHGSVRRMADEHVRKLDEMLAAMPIGYRLCLHEPEWLNGLSTASGDLLRDDSMVLKVRQKVHVLAPDETCHALSGRTEYGPKR